jgi:hypothetical protein
MSESRGINPVPGFMVAFGLGFWLGWIGGKQAMIEEMDRPLSWEEVQAELAREGLQ